ncbi:transposase IS2020, hypothetical [Roseovarius sp. 217]|nr:transposase IS2020, hypothetical [Roseovarius sp. 217]
MNHADRGRCHISTSDCRVRGKWTYLYRAVDQDGQTLDFMLSKRRDTAAARRFFMRAIGTNGVPDRIANDKSGANFAGLQSLNGCCHVNALHIAGLGLSA